MIEIFKRYSTIVLLHHLGLVETLRVQLLNRKQKEFIQSKIANIFENQSYYIEVRKGNFHLIKERLEYYFKYVKNFTFVLKTRKSAQLALTLVYQLNSLIHNQFFSTLQENQDTLEEKQIMCSIKIESIKVFDHLNSYFNIQYQRNIVRKDVLLAEIEKENLKLLRPDKVILQDISPVLTNKDFAEYLNVTHLELINCRIINFVNDFKFSKNKILEITNDSEIVYKTQNQRFEKTEILKITNSKVLDIAKHFPCLQEIYLLQPQLTQKYEQLFGQPVDIISHKFLKYVNLETYLGIDNKKYLANLFEIISLIPKAEIKIVTYNISLKSIIKELKKYEPEFWLITHESIALENDSGHFKNGDIQIYYEKDSLNSSISSENPIKIRLVTYYQYSGPYSESMKFKIALYNLGIKSVK